jgi:hypothetical protein
VVSFTPRPLYSWGKNCRYQLNERLGGTDSCCGRFEERFLAPAGTQTQDRTATCQDSETKQKHIQDNTWHYKCLYDDSSTWSNTAVYRLARGLHIQNEINQTLSPQRQANQVVLVLHSLTTQITRANWCMVKIWHSIRDAGGKVRWGRKENLTKNARQRDKQAYFSFPSLWVPHGLTTSLLTSTRLNVGVI